jgi:hypothetical protein
MTYQVLDLERIKGPDFILPMDEPPADVESLPLFDDGEQAAIDAALAAALPE